MFSSPEFSALLVIAAGLSSSARAADPDPKAYAGKDGLLSKQEMDVYMLHKADKTFFTYDTNKDGAIDASEARALIKKANESVPTILEDQRAQLKYKAADKGVNSEGPLTPAQASDLVVTPPSPTYNAGWLRIRGKVSDFAAPAKDRDQLLKLSPAILSYGRDYEKDADTWTAAGAIGGYWGNTDASFSMGAEFNRMDTNTPGKADIDSLVFKALGSGNIMGNDVVGAIGWSFGIDYGTNFDFDGGLLGASAEIEPLWNHDIFTGIHSFGGGSTADKHPALAMRNFIHLEGGGVVSDFATPTKANDDYFRVGPRVEATFWPAGTAFPLSFNASYGYYAALLGEDEDYYNFKAGAEWRLDEMGHFVLRAEYVNGLTALLLQDQETFLLSLGVRY